jgi:DNA-binding transcriptional LysR family regulator
MNAEVENDMKALQQSSCIRVGASVTVGAYVLPRLASDFIRANPHTEVEVYEDNTEKIENMLLHDQIDLGLVEGETVSPDIINQVFMDDELVIICSNKHRFSGQPSIEPYELEKEKFIIREKGSGTRKTFEDMMTANKLSWKAIWTCNNADTIKLSVAEGLGISAISRLSVRNETTSGMLCQTTVNGIQFKRQFKIIYHKNKYLTEAMKKLIEVCIAINCPK